MGLESLLQWVARGLIAAVLAIAAVAKLATGLRVSATQMRGTFLPGWLPAYPGAIAITALELLTAGLLVSPYYGAGSILALALSLVLFNTVSSLLARGLRPSCPCFGRFLNITIGWRLWLVDASLVALGSWLLLARYLAMSSAGAAALTIVTVIALAGLVQALRRHVHLLRHRLRQSGGLLQGTPVPRFSVHDFQGTSITSEEMARGSVVLFVFPAECPLCRRILLWLASDSGRTFAKGTEILIVGVYATATQCEGLAINQNSAVCGADAEVLRAAFKLQRLPAVVRISDGVVVKIAFPEERVAAAH